MSNAGTITAKIKLDTTELDDALAKLDQAVVHIRLAALDRALQLNRQMGAINVIEQARKYESYLRGDDA